MDELEAILAKHKLAPTKASQPDELDTILSRNGISGGGQAENPRMAAARAKLAAGGFSQTLKGRKPYTPDFTPFGDAQRVPAKNDTAIPVGASNETGAFRRPGLTESAAIQALAGLGDMLPNLPSQAINTTNAIGGLALMPFASEDTISRFPQRIVPEFTPVSYLAEKGFNYTQPKDAAERAYSAGIRGATAAAALPGRGLLNMVLAGLGMASGSAAKDIIGQETIGAEAVGSTVDAALAYGIPYAAQPVARLAKKTPELFGVLTNAGRERKVFKPMADEVAAAVADPQKLLADLRTPQHDVPGSAPLTASILAEHGAPTEQGRVAYALSNPAPGRAVLQSHLDANTAARNAAVEQAAPGSGGAANVQRRMEALAAQAKQRYDAAVLAAESAKTAAVSGAEAQRQAQQAAAQQAAEAAKAARSTAATGAVNSVGRDVSDAEAGAVISDAAEAAYRADRAPFTGERTGRFAPERIDPTGAGRIITPINEIAGGVAQYYGGNLADVPAQLQGVLSSIRRHIVSNRPPEPPPGAPKPEPVPDHLNYRQLKAVVERINNDIRMARADQNQSLATGLGKLKDDLMGRVESSTQGGQFPAEAAARYDSARADYAAMKARHGRYAANDITKVKGTGELVTSVADVPRAYFGRKPEDVQAFESTIGGNLQARQSGLDWLATQWRNAVMSPDRGGLKGGWRKANEAFMGRMVGGRLVGPRSAYSEAINAFPDLRQAMLDAMQTARTAEEFAAQVDANLATRLEGLARAERSAKVAASKVESTAKASAKAQVQAVKDSPVGFWFDPVDAGVAFDKFIHSPNSLRDAQAMAAMANKNPQFMVDLKVSLKEHLHSLESDKARVEFLKSPQARNLFDQLYGEDMGAAMADVARSAERDLAVQGASKVPVGSKPVDNPLLRDAMLILTAPKSVLAKWLAINLGLQGPLARGQNKLSLLHAKANVDPAFAAEGIAKRMPLPSGTSRRNSASARQAVLLALPQTLTDERRKDK
jgi:hypothetical protein